MDTPGSIKASIGATGYWAALMISSKIKKRPLVLLSENKATKNDQRVRERLEFIIIEC